MIYRLRHLPTGKFYKATSSGTRGKQNLSKKGKIYNHGIPQWDWVKFIYVDGKRIETQKSDWEIVKYELTEVETETFE